jgi:hypothetical protein
MTWNLFAQSHRARIAVVLVALVAALVAAPGGSAWSQRNPRWALRFAACMRRHGVRRFPNPVGGRFLITGGINPRSGSFKRAMRACRPLLPASARRAMP